MSKVSQPKTQYLNIAKRVRVIIFQALTINNSHAGYIRHYNLENKRVIIKTQCVIARKMLMNALFLILHVKNTALTLLSFRKIN